MAASSQPQPTSRTDTRGAASRPPGAPPPSTYGAWRVADSLANAKAQVRRATIVITIYLLILVTLPPEVQALLKVLGVELKDLNLFPSLLTLGLAVIIAHLCAVLARSARLARVHGEDPEFAFSSAEKLQIDVVTTDEFDEASLFASDSKWSVWTYSIVRATERFLTYLIFLALLLWAFWTAVSRLYSTLPLHSLSPVAALGVGGSVALLTVALLRLLQYWVIRSQTLLEGVNRLESEAPWPVLPRKYSITSVIVYILGTTLIALWFLVALNVLRLLLLPCRAKARESFAADKYSTDEHTVSGLLRAVKTLGWTHEQRAKYDDERRKESRNYKGWKKFLWELYGTGD